MGSGNSRKEREKAREEILQPWRTLLGRQKDSKANVAGQLLMGFH